MDRRCNGGFRRRDADGDNRDGRAPQELPRSGARWAAVSFIGEPSAFLVEAGLGELFLLQAQGQGVREEAGRQRLPFHFHFLA